MTADTPIETNFEELMCRESNGIHVSLFWNRPTNEVLVAVFDAATDTAFELEVGSANPLDVYNHPYAYAASDRSTLRRSRSSPTSSCWRRNPRRPSKRR